MERKTDLNSVSAHNTKRENWSPVKNPVLRAVFIPQDLKRAKSRPQRENVPQHERKIN